MSGTWLHRDAAISALAVPGAVTSLGVDPGGTAGLFLARWVPGQRKAADLRAWQVNAAGAAELLDWILAEYGREITCAGIEQFRPGHGRRDPLTRDQQQELEVMAREAGVILVPRPAATVKPWVTAGDRLKAAGLDGATAGQRHAGDGAGQALYAAVHDGGLPDPRSRRLLPAAGERGAPHGPHAP